MLELPEKRAWNFANLIQKWIVLIFISMLVIAQLILIFIYHYDLPYSDDYDTVILSLMNGHSFGYFLSFFKLLNGHEVLTMNLIAALNFHYLSGYVLPISLGIFLLNLILVIM